MTISNELMLAILAMDSYHRGYREGISGLGGNGSQLGTATLVARSDVGENSPDVAASFFAQAYTLADGRTVISYRGTDQALPSWENWTLGDVITGWTAGAGFIGARQARLAVEFYRSVAGQNVDPRGVVQIYPLHCLVEAAELRSTDGATA